MKMAFVILGQENNVFHHFLMSTERQDYYFHVLLDVRLGCFMEFLIIICITNYLTLQG